MNLPRNPFPIYHIGTFVVCLAVMFSPAAGAAGKNAGQGYAATENALLIEALEAFIPFAMRQQNTPGLNIAVARHGEIIWEQGFGYADPEHKVPMKPDTVMHSGSMGKTYTATAVMQLVERGIIDLNAPVNDYIKDFEIVNPLGDRPVTTQDLLTHVSGLTGNMAGSLYITPPKLGDHLKTMYSQTHFKPFGGKMLPLWGAKAGEKWQYSNLGMATLGYLVEVTNPDGLGFDQYVQKYIMDPLGMSSSMYPPAQDAAHVRPDIFKRMSRGYASYGAVNIPTPTIYFADYPAGTVVTTPGDHIKLLLAYLNEGNYNGYQLLKPETVKQMLSAQLPMGKTSSMGLTWMLEKEGELDFNFGHGGAHMYGWMNNFRGYPNQDFAVMVATNHWAMEQGRYDEHKLIFDFISNWLRFEDPIVDRTVADHQAPPGWAWKTAYVMGLDMAMQIHTSLGIEQETTPDMIDAMVDGALVQQSHVNAPSGWDAAGFRAGFADMQKAGNSIEALQGFAQSGQMKITTEELVQIGRELGIDAGFWFVPLKP